MSRRQASHIRDQKKLDTLKKKLHTDDECEQEGGGREGGGREGGRREGEREKLASICHWIKWKPNK